MDPIDLSNAIGADRGDHAITVGHAFGEIAFLLSQSTQHDWVALRDLPALLLPPIKAKQFLIFRNGNAPIGAALWAKLGNAEQVRVKRGIARHENRLTADEWVSGDHLWLIDVIAPFASEENRHLELILADLAVGPFSGKGFSVAKHKPGDPAITMGPAFGAEIVNKIKNKIYN